MIDDDLIREIANQMIKQTKIQEERNEILKEINISLKSLSEHGIDIGGEIATSIIQYIKE